MSILQGTGVLFSSRAAGSHAPDRQDAHDHRHGVPEQPGPALRDPQVGVLVRREPDVHDVCEPHALQVPQQDSGGHLQVSWFLHACSDFLARVVQE